MGPLSIRSQQAQDDMHRVVLPAYGAGPYLPAIVMERPVYVREMSDGLYSPLTYLLYKVSAPHTQTGTALCCLPASMR